MKINMKSVLKATILLGVGATVGHVTQVIHDCGIADPEDFNALGRFSMKVSKYWKTCGDTAAGNARNNNNKVSTPVDEADDELDLDDLPTTEEEPSD